MAFELDKNNNTCTACMKGNHETDPQCICDCPCHNFSGQDIDWGGAKYKESSSSTFPIITKEEISLYITSIGEHLVKQLKLSTNNNIELTTTNNMSSIDDPLATFMVSITKISHESKEFQQFLYACKQLLHTTNRTTGLMNIYTTGVLIGYFLAKPEMLPISNDPNLGKREIM